MKVNAEVTIEKVSSLSEIPGYWTPEDYVKLLDEMGYDGASDATDPAELREMLDMAINEMEPREAAEILLTYRLGEELSHGQIENISHEMQEDKVSEEYPNIALHYALFSINQLLHKAYNGKFPKVEASRIELELQWKGEGKPEVNKRNVLKAICGGLRDINLVKRLYGDQLLGLVEFQEADSIIWELHEHGQNRYSLITSDYWINQEDFVQEKFSAVVNLFAPKRVED